MAFILLYAVGYNKSLALKQWSTIYWNILKSSVRNCCHFTVPYNQQSEHSAISILYHMSVKWLAGWMGE